MRTMPPDAVHVEPLKDHLLRVTFGNGEIRDFDAASLLSRKCYAALKNPTYFRSAGVQYGCVTWPDGLDIDPDWLYADSVSLMH